MQNGPQIYLLLLRILYSFLIMLFITRVPFECIMNEDDRVDIDGDIMVFIVTNEKLKSL